MKYITKLTEQALKLKKEKSFTWLIWPPMPSHHHPLSPALSPSIPVLTNVVLAFCAHRRTVPISLSYFSQVRDRDF